MALAVWRAWCGLPSTLVSRQIGCMMSTDPRHDVAFGYTSRRVRALVRLPSRRHTRRRCARSTTDGQTTTDDDGRRRRRLTTTDGRRRRTTTTDGRRRMGTDDDDGRRTDDDGAHRPRMQICLGYNARDRAGQQRIPSRPHPIASPHHSASHRVPTPQPRYLLFLFLL